MAILSKRCKPDNFEPHNSLKLSFTNIGGLRSNFVQCESFLESNSPDILTLCETNLDDSVDSGNFSVRAYLPLIQKESVTHIHGFAFMTKRGFLCMRRITRKLCEFLYMFLRGFTSFSALFLFSLSITFLIFVHGF